MTRMLAAGLSGALILALAPAAGAAVPSAHQQLLLRGTVTSTAFLDEDHDGAPSAGDRLAQRETVAQSGRALGDLLVSCSVITPHEALCSYVWRLRTGTLVGQGYSTDDLLAPLDIALTGGTGAYAAARGTATVQNDRKDPSARDVERLDFS